MLYTYYCKIRSSLLPIMTITIVIVFMMKCQIVCAFHHWWKSHELTTSQRANAHTSVQRLLQPRPKNDRFHRWGSCWVTTTMQSLEMDSTWHGPWWKSTCFPVTKWLATPSKIWDSLYTHTYTHYIILDYIILYYIILCNIILY